MESAAVSEMTSNRPYLVRALYEWICDNGLTPYLLVDASADGVRVPPQSVRDGRVVLNVAPRAVTKFEMDNDLVSFQARFAGVPMLVLAPMDAILAIYAMENGQGMLFPAVESAPDETITPLASVDAADVDELPASGVSEPSPADKSGRGSHLRVVK